jgi:hypothetical protein
MYNKNMCWCRLQSASTLLCKSPGVVGFLPINIADAVGGIP